MANIVDARGRSCPEPVIMTKKAIDSGCENIEVLVDAKVAVENIKRFATSKGYTVNVEEKEDEFTLNIRK
ncbi:sulfurtransferase TusA family protein [Proteiniborus sp. MB09-C3]|uniref:sulfurtransferase TusA family protein n=1 Tax=Proteiniborus sp. MB09-C3 TaxID=3050072 RepID=UPI0025551B27|nr:sulfurtransferase TusA family protein [Proteiniborus sp. MB09-C3]WIV13258.1 sulfurtransferase TusA family protein [Proteiniborus sp. MB09-C3]